MSHCGATVGNKMWKTYQIIWCDYAITVYSWNKMELCSCMRGLGLLTLSIGKDNDFALAGMESIRLERMNTASDMTVTRADTVQQHWVRRDSLWWLLIPTLVDFIITLYIAFDIRTATCEFFHIFWTLEKNLQELIQAFVNEGFFSFIISGYGLY